MRLMYWLLDGSKGGPTRRLILGLIIKKPLNARQLAISCDLDYKTVQHHLELLEKNSIIVKSGGSYGAVYFISDYVSTNKEAFRLIQGGSNE